MELRLEQSSAASIVLDAVDATTGRDNGSAITVCLGVECVLAFKFDRVHFVPLQAVAIGKQYWLLYPQPELFVKQPLSGFSDVGLL